MAPLTATVCPVADGSVRIEAAGDLDVAWGHRLRDAVSTALDSFSPQRIEVGMQRITFLDSAGIGALIGALKEAREHGCALLVTEPTPFVHHILGITGLLEAFGSPEPGRADGTPAPG